MKNMVTCDDHLFFLVCIILFMYHMKDVVFT